MSAGPSNVAAEILQHHRVGGDNVYRIQLGNGQSSIKDQIRKAKRLIAAAYTLRVFERTGNTLLILGAGMAGVTAALRAAQLGVRTVLRERNADAFSLQQRCATRWIHPYEYDWPDTVWTQHAFPQLNDAQDNVLSWEADFANAIAVRLQQQLHATAAPPLRLLFSSPVHIPPGISPTSAGFRSVVDPDNLFGTIFFCIGAGEETTINDYAGLRFWDTDTVEQNNPGPWNVLIVGGGDGAQQDFLRSVFRFPPGTPVSPTAILRRLLPFLQEIAAFNTYVQTTGSRIDPGVLWPTDTQLITALRASPQWANIEAELLQIIDVSILNGTKRVELIIRRDRFGDAYTLNSFLCRLAASFLEQRLNTKIVHLKTEIESISSADGNHQCAKERHVCARFPHDVTLRNTQDRSTFTRRVHQLIIRFGVQPRA